MHCQQPPLMEAQAAADTTWFILKLHCAKKSIGLDGAGHAVAGTHLWHCQRAGQAAGRGCLSLGWTTELLGCWAGYASRFCVWEAAAAAAGWNTGLNFAAVPLLLFLWVPAACCLLSLLLAAEELEAP